MKSSFSRSRLLSCSFSAAQLASNAGEASSRMRSTSSRRQRLLLHHRGHHHARRRAADGAGQLRLDELHQLARRPRCGRRARRRAAHSRKQRGAPRRAEEARRQRQQVGHLARPRQNTGSCAGVGSLEHVDEQQRLAGLARATGGAPQRHRHVQRRCWPAGSRTARASGCPARQAQQLLGPQQRHAEQGPCCRKPAGSQPALGDRRQHQRVGPQQRARPPARPARRCACRPSSTCRPAAPARTAPPRQS
jgi:hypothetical protein